MIIPSPNCSNFDYSVTLDIAQATPKAIIEDISTYIGAGATNIIGINLKILSPSNIYFHSSTYPPTVDIYPGLTTDEINLPIFAGTVVWGTYKIYATFIDQDGTQYVWTENGKTYKEVTICKPNTLEFAKGNLGGLGLTPDFNCDTLTLTVGDTTPYSYKGQLPIASETDIVVTSPADTTGRVRTLEADFVPFTMQFSLTGTYDVTGTVTKTYQFSDTTFVIAGYYYSKSFDVQCQYSLCQALCDIQNLREEVKQCATVSPALAQEKQRKLTIINSLIIEAKLLNNCGVDAGDILEQIRTIGGFECNCNCESIGVTGLALPVGAMIEPGTMCGDISMTVREVNNVFELNLSDVSYSMGVDEAIADWVSFETIATECAKQFVLSIDFCAAITALGCGGGGGGGTVTSFSAGNLSPLFTTAVANPTTTPALSFALSNAAANTWFGNNTGLAAAPSYNAAGALSRTDDTNVTLTLGGSPTTALLNATSLTLGWTGVLSMARGGTNKALVASAGAIVYSDVDSFELSAVGVLGEALISGGAGAPTWSSLGSLAWLLNGNTVASEKWLGTIDSFDVPIRAFNTERFRVKVGGALYRDTTKLFSIPVSSLGNTTWGEDAGIAITSAQNLTSIGYKAGEAVASALSCTFIGSNAGILHQSGTANTIVGANVFAVNISGIENTIMGTGSAGLLTGSRNTFYGYSNSAGITTGEQNIIVGHRVGRGLSGSSTVGLTTGSYNILMGNGETALLLGTGTYHNLIGTGSGQKLTNGSFVTAVGAYSGFTSATQTRTDSIYLGASTISEQDSECVLGGKTVNKFYLGVGKYAGLTHRVDITFQPHSVPNNSAYTAYTNVTDGAGINWTFGVSQSTGTGASGDIIWSHAPSSGSTGTAANALVQGMWFKGTTGQLQIGATAAAVTQSMLKLQNVGTSISQFVSNASPESVITGTFGDICYVNTGAIGQVYVKQTGSATNTGWLALLTSGASGTIPVGTTGQTLYYAANGNVVTPTSNLFNDGTRIGIGVTPTILFHIFSSTSPQTTPIQRLENSSGDVSDLWLDKGSTPIGVITSNNAGDIAFSRSATLSRGLWISQTAGSSAAWNEFVQADGATGDVIISGKLTVTGAIDPTALYLNEQGSDPANAANEGVLYTKDVSTVTELYYRDSAGTVTQLTGGGTLNSANKALSNLASVSINTSLFAQTGVDLGAAATAFRTLYLYGAGTYSTTSMQFTGTPTGNRVITFEDATQTIANLAGSQAFTNKSYNGLTLTSTTGTFTLAAAKVFTVNNTLTLTATDGSTLAIGAGGTLGSNAYTSTAYAPIASPTFTGVVTIPTPFTLGATSVTSTGTQLNYLNAATGTTGTTTTNIVFSTSPVLTTPTLGVASATSINKVAITAPATSATLTIADGKTLTVSDSTTLATNSITFAGTEVLTLAATKSVTFADAFITSGAFSLTLTTTGTTNVTLPTTGTLATLAGVEVFTNKTMIATTNVVEQITATADSATPTPTGGSLRNAFDLTALAQAAAFASPSGTPANWNRLIIRIKDNGTARALTWDSIYTPCGVALPTTTVLSKILVLGFIYNTSNSLNKWQLIASSQEV